MIGIIRKSIAITLITVGVIGLLISALAIIDPVGTQMANDNQPFSAPPSLLTSLFLTFVFAVIVGVGIAVLRFRPKAK